MKQPKTKTETRPRRKIDPGEKVEQLMNLAENVAAGKAKLTRGRINRLTTDDALIIVLSWRYAGVLDRVDGRLLDAVLEKIAVE